MQKSNPLLHIVMFALMALIGALTLFGLSGCVNGSSIALTAQAKAEKLAQVALTVDKNCQIGLPFLTTMSALQTDPANVALLAKVTDGARPICAVAASVAHPKDGAAPTLDLAAIQTFANAQLPVLAELVKTSSLDERQKQAAGLAITGAQAALLIAVVNAQ
jgi:hypothetical protein